MLFVYFIVFMFILLMCSAVLWAYDYGRKVGWHEHEKQYLSQRTVQNLTEKNKVT